MTESRVVITADAVRAIAEFQRFRTQAVGALEHVSQAGSVIGKVLGAVGVSLSVAAFTGWIKGAIDATDVASDLSQKTGIAIEDLAGLELAFQKGGLESDALAGAMTRLSKGIAEGNETLEKLGINSKKLDGTFKSNKDVLYELADKFAGLDDGVQKTALAIGLFGKSGADLIPLLNEGSNGLREMDEMAHKLGLSLSEEAVNKAGDFNDTLDLLVLGTQGVARGVAAELIPTLSNLAGQFLTTMTSGDRLKNTAQFLASGLKLLYTIGIGIVEVFSTVGKTIAAGAAQLVAVLQGNFRQAAEIGRIWSAEVGESWAATARSISAAWGDSSDATVDAMAAVVHHSTRVGKSAAEVAAESQAAAKAQQEEAKLLRELSGLSGSFAQDWDVLSRAYAKGRLNLEQLTAAQAELLAKQPAIRAAAEAEAKAREAAAEFEKGYSDGLAATSVILEKMVDDARSEAEQAEETARTYGLSKAQIEQLTVARLEDQLAQRASLGLTLDEIETLENVIAAKKRTAAALGNMEEVDAQKEVWKSVDQTAHDTFVSIFDSGKSTLDRLTDTLKNGLLDLLYQMTLKKWIISVQADMVGSVTGQAASAALGGGSGVGGGVGSLLSAGNLVSAGSKAWSMLSGGFEGISTTVADAVQVGLNQAGLSSNLLSNGPVAQGAGAAAGYLAGGAVGVYGGRAISGGYAVSGSGNGLVNVGTLAGAVLGGPIGAAIGGLIAGGVNRLFGRKAPEVEAQGLRGIIGADGGVSGQAYKDIVEKGGLFRSTKRSDDDRPLNDQEQSQIGQAFLAITDASSAMAKSLGLGTEALAGYSKTFDIAFTNDAAKNQEAIEKFFGGVADEVANKLVPNLAEFSRAGEGSSVTLQRLAGEFQATTAAVQNIGRTAEQAFGDAGIASAKARERLVQLAGGSNELVSLTSAFSQSFLTDAERLAPMAKALDEELGKLGLSSIPKTNEQLKQLVQGLDPTNEAQAKLLVSLLQLAPAFNAVQAANEEAAKKMAEQQASLLEVQAQIYEITGDKAGAAAVLEKQHATALEALDPALRGATQQLWDLQAATKESEAAAARQASLLEVEAQIAELTGDKAGAAAILQQQHAAALAKLDPALRGATEKLWALQEAAKSTEQVKVDASALLGGVDDAYAVLQRVVEREKSAVQDSISAHTEAVNKLKSLSQSLHGTLDSLRTSDQKLVERETGLAQIRAALASARAGGPLPTAESLAKALGAAQQDASDQFGSYNDYLRDLYQTQSDIGALADLTDDSLSVEQQALEAAQDQLDVLNGVLLNAQEQIDVLKGQATTLVSIHQAVGALTLAIHAAQTNPVVSATSSIAQAYQASLGRAPDAAGLAFWQDKAAAGVSTPAIVDAISNSAEAKRRSAIQKLYQDLLGRKADDAGLGFFASNGSSLSDIEAAIKASDEYKVPGFANGGSFAGGIRAVGEVGIEIEATGPSRIHSTQSLIDALRNPSDNSAALVAEVRALRAEVQALRETNSAENYAIAKGAQATAEHLDAAVNGDVPFATKVVPA